MKLKSVREIMRVGLCARDLTKENSTLSNMLVKVAL